MRGKKWNVCKKTEKENKDLLWLLLTRYPYPGRPESPGEIILEWKVMSEMMKLMKKCLENRRKK